MDRVNLDKKNHKLVSQRNIFLFFSVASSLSVLLIAVLLFTKHERIVIVPTSGPSLWVENEKVSDIYLERFGSYIADLLLTRTPADVEYKNNILLEYVYPSFYNEAKQLLQKEKESIINTDQSLLFRPLRSFIDPSKQTYTTEGELLVFIGKSGEVPTCSQSEQKKFIFGFQCQGGKLLLRSLKKEDL